MMREYRNDEIKTTEREYNKVYTPDRYANILRHSAHQDQPKLIHKEQFNKHRRNQTEISNQYKHLTYENKLLIAEQKIIKYKNTILMMEETIEGLEKLNQELINQEKKHAHELQQFASNAKANIASKDKRIQQLEKQLKAINHSIDLSDQSLQSIQKQAILTKSLQFRRQSSEHAILKMDVSLTELSNENERLKNQIEGLNLEIDRLKNQLNQKNDSIEAISAQNKQEINALAENLEFYENIIKEKQQTIRKMSDFNNEICMKFINFNFSQKNTKHQAEIENNKQQVRQLQLKIENKGKMVTELQLKNKQLEKELEQILKTNQQFEPIKMELFEIIENQKSVIDQKQQEIQCLKNYNAIIKSSNSNCNVIESHMTLSDNNLQKTNIKKDFEETTNLEMQKVISQLNYWKNKSKSLWELLKNIEDESYFDHSEGNFIKTPKTIQKPLNINPNKTQYPRSSVISNNHKTQYKKSSSKKVGIFNNILDNGFFEWQQLDTNEGNDFFNNMNSSQLTKQKYQHNRMTSLEQDFQLKNLKQYPKRLSTKTSKQRLNQPNKPKDEYRINSENVTFINESNDCSKYLSIPRSKNTQRYINSLNESKSNFYE